jgi:hypothetical protein
MEKFIELKNLIAFAEADAVKLMKRATPQQERG